MAENPENLQLLIDICECWAKRFNISKCKIMVFDRPSSILTFLIYDEELSLKKKYN